MTPDGKGSRLNNGKLRMELVPTSMRRALARVFGYGANKYEVNNWKRGMKYSTVLGCLHRHLAAWEDGEDIDVESGLNHMDHVAANVAMLIEYIDYYQQGDDRYKYAKTHIIDDKIVELRKFMKDHNYKFQIGETFYHMPTGLKCHAIGTDPNKPNSVIVRFSMEGSYQRVLTLQNEGEKNEE